MKQLGLQTYCFSISWPRILPDGRGRVNPKGVDFYSRLIDELLENGRLEDWARIDYVQAHLKYIHKAIANGVRVSHYYLWSAFDNFEWVYGYKRRFGLIYVDFKTQERILKKSAQWYRQVIKDNGFD